MKNFKTNFLITLFFAIVAIAVFFISEFSLEPKIQSGLTRVFAIQPANPNVVMVLIDNKSVNRIRWPWDRAKYADMFEYIHDYGKAKVIAYDSLIQSPDENVKSDMYFFNKVKNYKNFISAFDASHDNNPEFTLTGKELQEFNKKFDLKLEIKDGKSTIPSPLRGILKLNPDYVSKVENFGSVVTPRGADGVIRTALPIVNINQKLYPMLTFYAYAKYMGIKGFYYSDGYLCSDDGCKTLKVHAYNSALGPQVFLKWYKPIDEFTTHKSYSAIDVLDSLKAVKEGEKPLIDPASFKDKIVIVGGVAAKVKSLEDIKSTPLIESSHAGADIQATLASNFLDNLSLKVLSLGEKALIAFLIVFISAWIIVTFGLTSSLIALGMIMLAYTITAISLFAHDTVTQIATPSILILLVVAAGFTYRFLIEGKKKEQIQNAMGMYISKDIMKNVVKNIDNIQLGGKRANISVLFSDIRGFTSISEKLEAEEVTEILNEYFSLVEPIIRKHNGVLNKFIGDAVLAIFGEPIQDKNHALNSVLCADEMHRKFAKLQEKWELEGKPHIDIGVAINTGDAFVGNIGSSERLEYTVIGDTVNTASRIEAYNKVYKTRFLISESTYEKVSRICDVIKIREVAIRGKSLKINIYEVLRVTPPNQ